MAIQKIDVLGKGYVRLVDTLGNDLSVINAARVSYDKESTEFNEKDEKLLKFLIREGHTSPFRHAALTFEVYAPLMTARQWYKYAVASTHIDDQNGWNESSRRYVTEEPAFYVPGPNEWRSSPANSKQGSGEPIPAYNPEGDKEDWEFNPTFGEDFTDLLNSYIETGQELYGQAMQAGICAEQARLFLPAYGMYVRWRWTVSLTGVLHFLNERLGHGAQSEIQDFAEAVRELIRASFPKTFEAVFER